MFFSGPSAPNPIRSSMTRGWLPPNAYELTQQRLVNAGISGPQAGYGGPFGSTDVTPQNNSIAFNAIASVVSQAYPGYPLAQLVGAVVPDTGGYTYQVIGAQKIRSFRSPEQAPAPRGPTTALPKAVPGSSGAPSTSTGTSGGKNPPKFSVQTAQDILAFVTAAAPGAVETVKQIIASTESLPSLKTKLAKFKAQYATETNPVKKAELQAKIKTIEAKIALYEQQAGSAGGVIGTQVDTGVVSSSVFPTWLPLALVGLAVVGGAVVLLSKRGGSQAAPRVQIGG